MHIHTYNYAPLSVEVLRDFLNIFPVESQPKSYKDNDGNGPNFFIFDLFISHEMVATARPVIHYVPTGEVINSASKLAKHYIGLLVRVNYRKVSFVEFTSKDGDIGKFLLSLENPDEDPVFSKGWNCFFLLDPKSIIGLDQVVIVLRGLHTLVGFLKTENKN